jgi:glucose-1-phosphate thymidylyltransferase
MQHQGILLAGGKGTRLGPLTISTNKHLLPIFDKPMIFYPLSTMILAGVKKIVLITSKEYLGSFQNLLRDGSQWGVEIIYELQEEAEGIPQALSIAEPHISPHQPIFLVLGDNVLYGVGTGRNFSLNPRTDQAEIFCNVVADASKYGVVELNSSNEIISIEEKPVNPRSNKAIVGLYSLPFDSIEKSKILKKSTRGEYEIIDLINMYNNEQRLAVKVLPRGTAWLDAGSEEGLMQSCEFVNALQNRQGMLIGSPDEAAWRMGNIDSKQLLINSQLYSSSHYGKSICSILEGEGFSFEATN